MNQHQRNDPKKQRNGIVEEGRDKNKELYNMKAEEDASSAFSSSEEGSNTMPHQGRGGGSENSAGNSPRDEDAFMYEYQEEEEQDDEGIDDDQDCFFYDRSEEYDLAPSFNGQERQFVRGRDWQLLKDRQDKLKLLNQARLAKTLQSRNANIVAMGQHKPDLEKLTVFHIGQAVRYNVWPKIKFIPVPTDELKKMPDCNVARMMIKAMGAGMMSKDPKRKKVIEEEFWRKNAMAVKEKLKQRRNNVIRQSMISLKGKWGCSSQQLGLC